MNILVCLKMVSKSTYADTLSEVDTSTRLAGGQLVINPADAYALELALRLKDKDSSVCISVMTMAPKSGEQILRTALAMGADRAYHISDMAFAGADTLATSAIIAEAIRTLPPQDIILCGKKAIDSETGHIGAQTAYILGLPFISNVLSFTPQAEGLSVTRSQNDGIAVYSCTYPALLTVINGTGMVRSPTIFGLKRAKDREITVLDSTRVSPAPSGTETVSVTEISFAHRNGIVEHDIDKGIEGLVKLL